MAVEIGQVIGGKYKLLRLLGDGGMGSVYEAEHIRLGTHVAIKVLHGDLARRSGLMERFLQEARVSAQIRSPHVVHVTDVDGTPDGVAYLVMELLQGEPLSSVERREKKLSVGTACEYTVQILQALEAAHALGVIHRDLKPDNVFVTFEGGKPVLKLIDFGIAKLKRTESSAGTAKNLTVAGMLMGTPEYMAPEQAYSADKVDVRADLYSVGVMLYEMLSGQTPVSGDDPRIVVTKVERGEVTPLVTAAPNVPPAIAGFVHKAMAAQASARFISATEMREELERRMKGGSATAPLAQVGGAGGGAGGSNRPPAVVEPAPAAAGEIGTGTVMGAPAPAALAAPPLDVPTHGGGGTMHAAPIVPAQAMSPAPTYEPSRVPQQQSGGGKGLVIALALIATLLGAGAVVAYVMSTQSEPTPAPVVVDTSGTSTAPTAPTTVATATTPPTVTTTTPLTPGPPVVTPPAPRPSGSAPPRPPASGAPSGSAAPNTPPPFVLPSGFPSAIPLPSGFPSALPSGFPPLPSGFPWPPPPAPAPRST